MKIRRIAIKDFGKLHNQTIDFAPGLNVLCGENESGKSTVHTFIKSMLYGMQRQRGRGAKKDTYSVYCPWENPASYGGILWFENGEKNFRLTRNFYKENQTGELLCENDGELLDLEQGDLDMALGGVSEAVYENTVSVAQLKAAAGPELVREVQNYMASFQGTGDSSVDLGRTMQMLKMTRKGYQVQEEKRKRELEAEKEKISVKQEYLQKEIQELRERRAQIQSQETSMETDRGERGIRTMENRIKELERKRKKTFLLLVPGLLAFVCVIAACILYGTELLSLHSGNHGGVSFPAIVIMVLLALAIACILVFLKKQKKEIETYRKLLRKRKGKQDKLAWNREKLEEEEREKRTVLENLMVEYRETEDQEYLPSEDELEVEAVNLAMETIEMLSERIHTQVGGSLRERTSEILSEITGGKYREVLLDADLHISINTGDRIVRMESLSRGTVEQIYFSLRMAAGELLCGEEEFPVFLDEIFGMYDSERLLSTLRWLAAQNRQVILTTCQPREIQLLETANIPYHKIAL